MPIRATAIETVGNTVISSNRMLKMASD